MFRGLVAAIGLVLVVGTASAQRAARPHTLATTRGSIDAVAQDGRRVAWVKTSARCGRQVQILTLPSRQPVYVGAGRSTCGSLGTLPSIALAGTRALWQVLASAGNTEADVNWVTATLGQRRARVVAHRFMNRDASDPTYDYEPPLPLAGDGKILAFYSLCDFEGCSPDESVLRRVVGRRTRKVGSVFQPQGLSVSNGRLAYMTINRLCCNSDPRFSPDGQQVAWSYSGDLWVVKTDGTDARRVAAVKKYVRNPSWSPDGQEIAFEFGFQQDGVDVAKADGSGVRQLVASGNSPAWSPDGTRIAFVRGTDVYTIKPDGSAEKRLTTNGLTTAGPLSWSPDSTQIAVSRSGDIYAVRADGSGETRLTTSAHTEVFPAWSPDGARIAYADADVTGIYVMNANGTGAARLTTGADIAPAWSPDSGQIAFGRAVDELWVVNADGNSARRLTPKALEVGLPQWAPGGSIAVGDDIEGDPPTDPAVRLVSPADDKIRKLAPPRRTVVAIRNAFTGGLAKRFTIDGHAYSIALGPDYVALLVFHDPGTRVELWNLNGSYRKAAPVPAGARDLSAAGRNVVFAVGRLIRRLDARTGAVWPLVTAAARPVGPVIEGRRVVWAENIGGNSRVRSVTAP